MLILSTLQRVASLMGAEGLDAAPHLISDMVDLADGGALTTDYARPEGDSPVMSKV